MQVRRSVLFALCIAAGGCAQAPPEPEPDPASEEEEAQGDSPVVPTMRLTASDGTGLELVALEVRGAVQGPLGFTELHMVFDNPEPRVLAGQFTIDLPPGAALSRFSMKVNGSWQEGEVVERQSARRIYDQFLHNNVDPALLEKQAGNRFSAKVFPIPAHGRKELILSYSQVLDGHASYRVPLRGLPLLERFDATVFVDEPNGHTTKRRVVERHEVAYVPRKDLEITAASPTVLGLRGDEGVAASIVVEGDSALLPMDSLTIAFDTSASRAIGFSAKVRVLDRLIAALSATNPRLQLRVVAFDQDVQTIFEGAAADFDARHRDAILARLALGASDLGHLFERLASDDAPTRLLLMTDGVATVGDTELAGLREDLASLEAAGLQRLDAVLDAGIGSDALVKDLVRGHLEHDGVVTRSDHSARELANKVARRVLDPIAVSVDGASRVWPTEIRGAQPGDSVMVYAHEAPKGDLEVSLSGGVSQTMKVPTADVPGPLISRALAAAKIDALTAEYSAADDKSDKAALRHEIVDLSRSSRVISDFTAMLVLESDFDYRRFDLDRTAEVDILVVGTEGAERVARSRGGVVGVAEGDPSMAARRAGILGLIQEESGHFLASPYGSAFAVGNADEDVWGGLTGTEVGEAFGVGGLGLVGTGRGGGGTGEGTIGLGNVGLIGKGGGGLGRTSGTGYGRGFTGRGARTPTRVRSMPVAAEKGLSKNIIRRIARAHVNELRHCYNNGLAKDPTLKGELDVVFTIASTGRVAEARVGQQRTDDGAMNQCARRTVRRWKFPRPSTKEAMEVTLRTEFGLIQGRRAPLPYRWNDLAQPRPSDRAPESLEKVDAELSIPHEGKMLEVSRALEAGDFGTAVATATQWRREAPTNVLALIALGRAYEATGRRMRAARAYGSIVDAFPSDAPMLRHASDRLMALGTDQAKALALDASRQAFEERADHPSSHRAYAWALVAADEHEKAFEVLLDARGRSYDSRYVAARHILNDDASAVAARWIAAEPSRRSEILQQLKHAGVRLPKGPVTRFILSWETDANDVDLHVYDKDGYHAYYREPALPSGGHLYGDVTDGYGPESYTIRGEPKGFPYRIDVDYFSRGPMGYGLGSLQVVSSDPSTAPRMMPFVLMMEKGRARLMVLEDPNRQP